MLIRRFGQQIQIQREALDLSREELAHRVGVTRRSIYRIERGEQFPSSILFAALCETLRIKDLILLTNSPLRPVDTECHAVLE